MVKGVNRRVIVVKSPDPRYFEEAIFIVKEDVSITGVDVEHVLQEARAVANGYVKRQGRRGFLTKIPPPVYLAAGAVLSAAVMMLT